MRKVESFTLMIPSKKNDRNTLTPLMSRVQPSRPPSSMSPGFYSPGTTPNPSSLNPVRGGSKVAAPTKEQIFETKFNSLEIVETINRVESQLSTLGEKISSYDGDDLENVICSILEDNDSIFHQIEELSNHQMLGERINTLENEQKNLDDKSKNILRLLTSYRNELRRLPSAPTKKPQTPTTDQLDIEELLKYGMKLSKFTKAPPTVNGVPFATHPNNYIWPAEDALRRGNLALTSLHGDTIIKKELGADFKSSSSNQESNKPTSPKQLSKLPVEMEEPPKPERRSSRSTRAKKPEPVEDSGGLDLDLFDPDNEDSD